jgi:hypothetical protein
VNRKGNEMSEKHDDEQIDWRGFYEELQSE